MALLKDVIWSNIGFEDLRKYCKQSSDFCRDVASIIHERAKIDISYGDAILKLSIKARKATGDTLGTLKQGWECISTQLEREAEVHKILGTQLIDDLVKPLKTFTDTQKETRKQAEQNVDKAVKILSEKRSDEVKAKKTAFSRAKESETLTVQLESSRGKTITDKELSRLDAKCKKAEESVIKTDKDHIRKLVDVERARLALESALTASCNVIQRLEEERVTYLRSVYKMLSDILIEHIPKVSEFFGTMKEEAEKIDVLKDMEHLKTTRGSERQPADQVVYDCYEADFNNSMDAKRRKLALETKLSTINRNLQAEIHARSGLERLSSVYQETPKFADMGAQEDVSVQLAHADAVIDCLDASAYRLLYGLAKLKNREPPAHRLQNYLVEGRDKQGLLLTYLRVPIGRSRRGSTFDEGLDYSPYGAEHHQYDSEEGDDEFDGPPEEQAPPAGYSMVNMCRVNYEYIAAQPDELTIKPGDIVTLIEQNDDGWWTGELNGKTGLFPASYVDEI